jgi:hypothetical protein
MASISGWSSASGLRSFLNRGCLQTASFLHRLPYRTDLVAPVVLLITPGYGTYRQHTVHSHIIIRVGMCSRHPAVGCVTLFIKNLLPNNWHCFVTLPGNRSTHHTINVIYCCFVYIQMLLYTHDPLPSSNNNNSNDNKKCFAAAKVNDHILHNCSMVLKYNVQ